MPSDIVVSHVLLLEDNPADIRLIREAFVEESPKTQLHTTVDGIEAVAFLKRWGRHTNAPRPDLILLDLNLPKINGSQLLTEIKGDETLLAIPTVVLTASESASDILACYRLGANCYLLKPADWQGMKDIVKAISFFWLVSAARPQTAAQSGMAAIGHDFAFKQRIF